MNRWMKIAIRNAVENYRSDKSFSLAAVLIKGGSVISIGVNKRKTDPVVKRLSCLCNLPTRKHRQWMHAELDCINRIPLEKTKGTVLYVARVTKDLHTANAKPCDLCTREIFLAGIRKVVYTICDGEVGIRNISYQ